MAPAEDLLQGMRRVMVVGDGPIHTLPLEMLVTRYGNDERRAFAAHAPAAARRHRVRDPTLPRRALSFPLPTKPRGTCLAHGSTPSAAWLPHASWCRSPTRCSSAVARATSEATRGMLAGLTRSAGASVHIPRLPETADEAHAIAQVLGGKAKSTCVSVRRENRQNR